MAIISTEFKEKFSTWLVKGLGILFSPLLIPLALVIAVLAGVGILVLGIIALAVGLAMMPVLFPVLMQPGGVNRLIDNFWCRVPALGLDWGSLKKSNSSTEGKSLAVETTSEGRKVHYS